MSMDLRTATKIIVSNKDFVFADAQKELRMVLSM